MPNTTTPSRTTVAIIILNYKTPDLVVDCLQSLEDQIEPGMDVLVVDNASNDGSAEKIEAQIETRHWGSWARFLRAPVNGGFAAGNNIGLKAIDKDAYILLNSDTIVLPNAIAELLRARELWPNAGLIGPGFVTKDGSRDLSTFRLVRPLSELVRSAATGPVSRLLKNHDTLFWAGDTVAQPDWIGFAAVLIRREVIEQVGLLDEGFFMYFEDADYCRRVRNAGWTILYWPTATIVHLLGGSSKFSSESGLRARAPRYFYESRSRYFAKHFGRMGLLLANLAWLAGRCISLPRELLGKTSSYQREHEARDNWINFLDPLSEVGASRGSEGGTLNELADQAQKLPEDQQTLGQAKPAIDVNPTPGDRNQNPDGISFLGLIAEDFRTHDSNPFELGFWAVAIHRYGNLRMSIKPRLLRLPFSLLYNILNRTMAGFFGIDLNYATRLGRRVRIWHHGGMFLGAISIGDDVTIRHNTTMGVLNKEDKWKKPIIEDRVDIGSGACILGDVRVGHDSIIGANSVVVRSFPPHSTLFGVPARRVNVKLGDE